ncbi:helicase superfamily protein II [Roseibium sp. TrichSKD4]|uniref:DEAD/DEAH box helicase n=1 Tax=Roseibium sp. TrichSKD4 TaxID=744980 RepID=UPI0001E57231|nr:DEAD/DEAH box helicase [Roseibium sp. TrichSKD4]EFO28799.1 helicase superfamily protein II [Roseibium sp. TrichSKD4]
MNISTSRFQTLSSELRITPYGHLVLDHIDTPASSDAHIEKAFSSGAGQGLLHLGACKITSPLPPALAWWRAFAARYVTHVCLHTTVMEKPSSINQLPNVPPPDESELEALVNNAPMMTGAEYLTTGVLRSLWEEIANAAQVSLADRGCDLQSFLKEFNPAWNLVGRVYFSLAENRNDPDAPFAFMATYTHRLSAQARAQHLPLGQALREYSGAENRSRLLSLLVPVQRAAETCHWLKPMIDKGEIFHPLRWTSGEAARFLQSATDLEQAGVLVRMPASWRAGRPSRPQVSAVVGNNAPSSLGLNGLLDFRAEMTLEGEPLSRQEIDQLLDGTEGLVLLRGQWIEVDRERLTSALDRFKAAEELAERDGLTFAMAMRMLARVPVDESDNDSVSEWSSVTAGTWMETALRSLRAPDGCHIDAGPALRGNLRPYQRDGVQWLNLLSGLGLGACLADDMGLGKTIQVLALLLSQRQRDGQKLQAPSLLVAPASLLANWIAEIERFAPSLKARILHPSAMKTKEIQQFSSEDAQRLDLVITSYGTLLRAPTLSDIDWRLVILDEAQAIKNPKAKQTRAVKTLKTQGRIALTGTPVENSLGDLWSIFDFINPGLLGSAKQFSKVTAHLAERGENSYGPLRELVRPYILRRMKTDKSIIADLPDKPEVKAHCHLSRRQAALYAQTVDDLAKKLEHLDGIQRRGLVLATLMRLKQICNHPSQWLDDDDWNEADSGKLARLREISEVVASRQEKMLVFTQFQEVIEPLRTFLGSVFGKDGLVLHGGTAVAKRKKLVSAFQEDETIPFFILSLKAGGSGLTLTAASHVVHFDRWWNPAVENQATDRAYRIGQKKNVLVHKLLCRGTMEEKIDAMINTKQELADALLSKTKEINLTELSDDALLDLVRLDLNAAVKE